MTIEDLNHTGSEIAQNAFLACCGSRAWADAMTSRRPYADPAALRKAAEQIWWSLKRSDWLEAFAAHPKIGEKKPDAKWSENEQSGMARASETTAGAIARLNNEYEARFGWIFIVCATGKSGDEMLHLLKARLGNDSEAELVIAAGEQLKITQLRLQKLVAE